MQRSSSRPVRWAILVALALALVAAGVLLFLPTYSNGATIVEENGTRSAVTLFVPAVVALVALAVARWPVAMLALAGLLGRCVLVSMASIGISYVPAPAALAVAAVLSAADRWGSPVRDA